MDNVALLPDDPTQPMRMLVASDMYLSGPRCKDGGRHFHLHTKEGPLEIYINAGVLVAFAREVIEVEAHS